jgi:hypothetical protein
MHKKRDADVASFLFRCADALMCSSVHVWMHPYSPLNPLGRKRERKGTQVLVILFPWRAEGWIDKHVCMHKYMYALHAHLNEQAA